YYEEYVDGQGMVVR
nr:RecName: Full=Uncharacterized protein IMPP17 [Nautilus macromphalus]